jgi:plasmid stabilization system protein ParE
VIPLSAAAEGDLDDLTTYYAERGRDRAIERLIGSVEAVCARYLAKRGSFLDAPRPYPALADLGFRRTKEDAYWFAFQETAKGPILVGIYHEAADIPGRARAHS